MLRGGKRPGAGRPKGVKSTVKVRGPVDKHVALSELAREHTADALKTLVDICKDKETPAAARVSAASALLDRGYGKPRQEVEHSGEVNSYDPRLNGCSTDQLREIDRILANPARRTNGARETLH